MPLVIAVIALLAMTACTSSNSDSSLNDMELSDIMTALYQGLEEDELPNFGEPVMVTDENVNWYLGLTSCDFAEALASEPMISSIAHSVVLVRLNDGQDAEALETAIQADLNTYKWICVGVPEDELVIEQRGNVLLVMIDGIGIGDTIVENFNSL